MMNRKKNQVRTEWLQEQGYVGFSDREYAAFGNLTRLAPAVCVTVAIIATILESTLLFGLLTAFALLGALLPRHPFDSFYNRFIAPVTDGARLPAHGIPRRFACALATPMLAGAGWAYGVGADLTGLIIALNFIVVATIPVVTGFCVPSRIFRTIRRAFNRPSGEEIS